MSGCGFWYVGGCGCIHLYYCASMSVQHFHLSVCMYEYVCVYVCMYAYLYSGTSIKGHSQYRTP